MNGFALGLVLGLSLATIFLLYAQVIYEFLTCQISASCVDESSQTLEVFKRLIKLEDSLAQWTMAVFSILATLISFVALYFLFQTHKLTQKTLIETQHLNSKTTEIGIVQTRAYVSAGETKVEMVDDFAVISVTLRNRGQSPAKNLLVSGTARCTTNPHIAPVDTKFSKLGSKTQEHSCVELNPDETFHLKMKVPRHVSFPVGHRSDFGFNVRIFATYKDIYFKRRKLLYFGWISEPLYLDGERRLRVGNRHNRST